MRTMDYNTTYEAFWKDLKDLAGHFQVCLPGLHNVCLPGVKLQKYLNDRD